MTKTALKSDPLAQFLDWHRFAHQNKEADPDAMTLATASQTGQVSARIVLFKGISDDGFMFYTNGNSVKIQNITENAQSALVFYWPKVYRQVRVEGLVGAVDDSQSDQYFSQRQQESQLAAWASEQSREIESREYLLARYSEYEAQFAGKPVPRPEHWRGYRLMPQMIEFWQGLDYRLHDRFCYRNREGSWQLSRLAP